MDRPSNPYQGQRRQSFINASCQHISVNIDFVDLVQHFWSFLAIIYSVHSSQPTIEYFSCTVIPVHCLFGEYTAIFSKANLAFWSKLSIFLDSKCQVALGSLITFIYTAHSVNYADIGLCRIPNALLCLKLLRFPFGPLQPRRYKKCIC